MGYKISPGDPSPLDFDEDEEGPEFADHYRRDVEADLAAEDEAYELD